METLVDTLKKQIVTTLNLSDVKPEDIDPDAPLIGEGLGLDSIDSLELLVLLEKQYGVTVPNVNVGKQVFTSVRSLASYIEQQQKKG
jgi:acyl carrier protein